MWEHIAKSLGRREYFRKRVRMAKVPENLLSFWPATKIRDRREDRKVKPLVRIPTGFAGLSEPHVR